MSTSASKRFREACGLKAPLTLECAGPGRSHDRHSPYRRDEPFALLGRDGCSDLVLDDPQVSRRHAFLQAIEGRVFCFDLESRTKLIWEGEVSPRPGGWLEPGREIKVGPYAIRWTTPETSGGGEPVSQDPLGPEELEPGRTAPMPQAGLELPIRAGKEKSSWWLEGRMGFVGRSETCQLVLSEASVSRFHAALIRTSVGVWVVDLWAREGTLVNDLKVRWAWLDEGDRLRIGRFLFVVRYKAPPEGISRRLVPLDAGAILETSQGESPSDTTPGQRRTLATRPKVRLAPPGGPQGTIPSATVVLARKPFFEPELQATSQHMAIWQQQMQMMESFHNDMILMVQMFMAMHREHVISVSDELDRISQLTQEMSDLRARLAGIPEPETPNPPTSKSSAPSAVAKPESSSSTKANGTGIVDRSAREPAGVPAGRASPVPPTGTIIPVAPSDRSLAGPAAGRSKQAINVDFHSHLTRRVAELQRERQSYWQKILSVITG